MAVRWSSEHVVVEHRDLQATTMVLDCSGQFAALAGRRYVAMVRLEKPGIVLKKLHRQSKWEVSAAEWNPHNPKLFALSCNQRAELLNWLDGDLSSSQVLRGHTRAISDMNWSPFDSNILATASIDTFINIWDIRDYRKPVMALSAVAGATQVKWNKLASNILATAHEGDIRLWDPRKAAVPYLYIAAHLSKIHGLDWNPLQENALATSSQDCTVKFWDLTNTRRPETCLASGSPVWRARYTPFGEGMVTVVVPQLRRGENSLVLWKTANLNNPVHTFVGHKDVVLEFGWSRKKDCSDYLLVTWSKDHSLRIWTVDSQLQKLCGHSTVEEVIDNEVPSPGVQSMPIIPAAQEALSAEPGNDSDELTDASQATQTSAHSTEVSEHKRPSSGSGRSSTKNGEGAEEAVVTPTTPTPPSPLQPQNLQQEFSLVNINIPNVRIDEMNPIKRTCTVTAVHGKHVVCLRLMFPNSYPYNSPPTFQFCPGTTVDANVRAILSKVLHATSQQHVKRNRSCLEPCLRQLIATLESSTPAEVGQSDAASSFSMDPRKQAFITPSMYGSFQDSSIPFPRTSGARFCGAGFLVCFARPPHLQRMNAPTELTPRSLSALGAYLSSHMIPISGRTSTASGQYSLMYPTVTPSPTGDASVSISSFYFQDRKVQSKHKRDIEKRKGSNPKQPTLGAVLIYTITGLMPINYLLAKNYILGEADIVGMCNKNAAAAAAVGRKDLVQVWTLASLTASPSLQPSLDPCDGTPWAQHPFGRKMLQSIIYHYIKIHDVQTAAMLCCVFSPKTEDVVRRKKSAVDGSPGGSPYHTVVPTDTTWESWNFVGALKRNRSNSWSDSVEEFRYYDSFPDARELEREHHEANTKLLDPKLTLLHDQFKKVYADILYQWNLLEQRAQVLKYVSTPPEKHKGVEFLTVCQMCQRDMRGPQCLQCKTYIFQCVICRVSVKGSSVFCLACGHGGHTSHLLEWFQEMDICAAGCGCCCLQASEIFSS